MTRESRSKLAMGFSLAFAATLSLTAFACGGGGATGASPGPDAANDATLEVGPDAPREVGGEGQADAPGGAADAADASRIADAADASAPQAIGIPMYMDPTASPNDWTETTAAAPAVALLVANPNSGPGGAAQPGYTQAIVAAHGAHQTIVGYVHTSYGARAIAQVEGDVDAWYTFYPAVDGIFYDEASSDPATMPGYYKPIYDHVKAKSTGPRTVVINPGTIVDEAFMQAADVVVTFEDTYAHYTDGSYPANPPWMASYSRWRFWHLVLSAATTADMQNAVVIARQRNVGMVYVTDQPPATAYSQLVVGTYWQGELAAVNAP